MTGKDLVMNSRRQFLRASAVAGLFPFLFHARADTTAPYRYSEFENGLPGVISRA